MNTEIKRGRVLRMRPEAPELDPAKSVVICVPKADRHEGSTLLGTKVGSGVGLPSQDSSDSEFNFDVKSASERTLSFAECPPYDAMKHARSIAELREGIWCSASQVPIDDIQLRKYFCLHESPRFGNLDYKYTWNARDHPHISKKDLFTIETFRSDSAMWPIALQVEQALKDDLERLYYMAEFFSAIVQRLYEKKIKEFNN